MLSALTIIEVMKRFVKYCILCVLACVLCGCRTRSLCVLYGKPPTLLPADFVGNWIGFEESDRAFYLLNLNTNGQGFLKSVYNGNIEVEYALSTWQMTSNNIIACKFLPDGDEFAPNQMVCRYQQDHQLGALLSGERGWRQQIVFRRVSFLKGELSKLGLELTERDNGIR